MTGMVGWGGWNSFRPLLFTLLSFPRCLSPPFNCLACTNYLACIVRKGLDREVTPELGGCTLVVVVVLVSPRPAVACSV
jgi:hypothetical protein